MLDIYLRNLKDILVDPVARSMSFMKQQGITPNSITLLSGVVGLLAVYNSISLRREQAVFFWGLSRFIDGLDGAYARMTDQVSDFGGYLDICVDFTIYGLIPLGVTAGTPSYAAWVALGILQTTFFVNAAGLFMLSALIEKNKGAQAQYKATLEKRGTSKLDKEVTSVKMPPALIEGFERIVLSTLILSSTDYHVQPYSIFAIGVTITILQRLWWAKNNL